MELVLCMVGCLAWSSAGGLFPEPSWRKVSSVSVVELDSGRISTTRKMVPLGQR